MGKIDSFFYAYLYGDWESLTRWAWIYVHASILLATGLVGFTFERGEYVLTSLLLPFPFVYLYKRYEKAKSYTVRSETPP